MVIDEQRTAEPVTPVVPRTQLRPPPAPVGSVGRTRLVDELRRSSAPVVHLGAPPGWGKTTLLSQWRAAELDDPAGREVCWLTFTENEQSVDCFLRALTEACRDGCSLFGLRLSDVGTGSSAALLPAYLPRFVDEIAAAGTPLLIIIDDLAVEEGSVLAASLDYLIRLLPPGVQLALASDQRLPLALARLRPRAEVLELDADRLRFGPDDLEQLAELGSLPLDRAIRQRVLERTEGWPVAVSFALRALEEQPDQREALDSISGRDESLKDFLDEELLARLPDDDVYTLTCSAILDTIEADVVDRICARAGASRALYRLATCRGFIEPLDRKGWAYRFHPLFHESLARRLEETVPAGRLQLLHERAATALLERGATERAVKHAVAASKPALAADGLAERMGDLVVQPDRQLVGRSLAELERAGAVDHPPFLITAALFDATGSNLAAADARLGAVARHGWRGPVPGGWSSVDEAVAVISAAFLDRAVDDQVLEIERAISSMPCRSAWYSVAEYAAGRVYLLAGDFDRARSWLLRSSEATIATSPVRPKLVRITSALAASYLAVLSAEAGEIDQAERYARAATDQLEREVGLFEPISAPGALAQAILLARTAQRSAAIDALTAVAEHAPPDGSVRFQALIELARISELSGDLSRARSVLADAEDCASRIRGADALRQRLSRLISLLHGDPLARTELVAQITDGELAVLRLLPTDLTQRQIARSLELSINTVKSHLRSIYLKLGVSSRPAAVGRARALGLLLDDWGRGNGTASSSVRR